MEQDAPRTEGQVRDGALRAVQALRLGLAHAYRNADGPGTVRFTIVMDDARCATDHRLKRMVDRIEANGFRVRDAVVHDATLRADAIRSQRTVGAVSRIAQDGDATILTLQAAPSLVWRVPHPRGVARERLLLTRADDVVELWTDLEDGPASRAVDLFRNRSMPEAEG